jgi:hypothetical protein
MPFVRYFDKIMELSGRKFLDVQKGLYFYEAAVSPSGLLND